MPDLNPDQSSISKFAGSPADHKQIAVVTGASTGIGFELAGNARAMASTC